jgi:3-oxoacyl-[acyl-carrier protein] reductase
MSGLSGRVALVTGGGTGIGRATALALAREGADVAVHYRSNHTEAEEAAQAIQAMGRRALVLQADLTKGDEVRRTIDAVTSELARIDILVNNAGGLIARRPLSALTETLFHDVMDVNVLTAILCSQAVIGGMIERRQGTIINMTSLAAHNGGGPGASIYAAAKSAVLTLTKAWARELAPHGIRVNAVSPGLIGGTPFHRDFTTAEAFAAAIKTIPAGRAGEPADVANVIAFLASDAASFLVGETIEINGGMFTR